MVDGGGDVVVEFFVKLFEGFYDVIEFFAGAVEFFVEVLCFFVDGGEGVFVGLVGGAAPPGVDEVVCFEVLWGEVFFEVGLSFFYLFFELCEFVDGVFCGLGVVGDGGHVGFLCWGCVGVDYSA